MLLEEPTRSRIRGLIVNKFRGDMRLFADGVTILEQRGGVPVIAVVPFIRHLNIADEDSVALDDRVSTSAAHTSSSTLDIAVIRLAHISNFDDFDPLAAEADTNVRFVEQVEELGRPDLLILPGTKTTVADLQALRANGLAKQIVTLVHSGVPVIGICGGYQMLGAVIRDPDSVESDVPETTGLDLLPLSTTFVGEKQTVRAQGRIVAQNGLFAGAKGLDIVGYEIHMGRTDTANTSNPLVQITARRDEEAHAFDGATDTSGWVAGSYFHGLFDNDALRHCLLRNLARRKGITRSGGTSRFDREVTYDHLAATVRQHLNLEILNGLIAD